MKRFIRTLLTLVILVANVLFPENHCVIENHIKQGLRLREHVL